jgi:hypothetical protein
MNSNVHLLESLKRKLRKEKDFFQTMHYFYDHFGENDAFMKLGKRTRHPQFEAILQQAANSLMGSPATVRMPFLIYLPKQHFIHGACMVNGCMGNYIFFEDIISGLLAVVMPGENAETKIARITAHILPDDKTAKWN